MSLKRYRAVILCLTAMMLLCLGIYLQGHLYDTDIRSEASDSMSFGLALQEEEDGLYVVGVRDHSPASSCGIAAGDLLTCCGEKKLHAMDELDQCLRESSGRSLELTLNRSGKEMKLTIDLH